MKNFLNKMQNKNNEKKNSTKDENKLISIFKNAQAVKGISFIVIFLVILVLATILMTGSFSNSLSIKSDNGYYQIFNDTKISIGNGKLTQTKEETLILSSDEEDIPLDNTPLYVEGEDQFYLTTDMTYVDYIKTLQTRAPKLGEFSLNEETGVVLDYDGKETPIPYGFLFDGKDVYTFLEEVELTVDGKNYLLPAFSFVKKLSTEYLTIYDFETKEATLIQNYKDVKIHHDAFELDLIFNMIEFNNGSSLLLFTDPKILDLL